MSCNNVQAWEPAARAARPALAATALVAVVAAGCSGPHRPGSAADPDPPPTTSPTGRTGGGSLMGDDSSGSTPSENRREQRSMSLREERLARGPVEPPMAPEAVLDRLDEKRDGVDEVVFYHHRYADQPSDTASTRAELYIVRSTHGGEPILRFRAIYHGDRWLFADAFTVKTQYARFDRRGEFDRNSTTEVWEVYDEPTTDADVYMVQTIILSEDVVLRFRGDRGHYDYRFTEMDKLMMQDMLTAYEVLGGTLPE